MKPPATDPDDRHIGWRSRLPVQNCTGPETKQARTDAGLPAHCATVSHSAVPMTAVMMKAVAVVAMMMEVVPVRTVPAMMVVTMMMAPVLHVRRRELGILLNGGRGGRIVERERVGALGGRRKRQQRAYHSQSQNFRYTH
jgi:hypothetical protein